MPADQFPALQTRHINNARLYADRNDLIAALALPSRPVIAEIGVAHGDFSDFLIRTLRPSRFVALDLFKMHEAPMHWGIPQEVLFKGMTHEDFYRRRFVDQEGLEVIAGMSGDTLPTLKDASFDLIYVDAEHTYDGVRRDAELAAAKVKTDGVLVFNDYILFDHMLKAEYGVVQAVNELVVDHGWQVVGFALQRHMFCDIAVRRTTSG